MSSIEEIERQIQETKEKVSPLLAKMQRLQMELSGEKSRNWIKLHSVTRNKVESPPSDIYSLDQFGKWLKKHSSKQFCEWNGVILNTSEVILNRVNWNDCHGRYADLLENEEKD